MKRILVTGAANGLGRHMSTKFLSRGFYVTLADHDTVSLEALEQLLANDPFVFPPNSGRSTHSHALFYNCNISDELSVSSCIAATIEKFSGLDALINNAALASPWIGGRDDPNTSFDAVPVSHFRNFIEINLTGPYICSRYAAPHLRASKGCIVNISSTRALQSEANNEGYSASKAGLIGLTQAMAVSFSGSGVRVNAVSPGWIDTCDMDTRLLTRQGESTVFPSLTESDHSQHPAGRVGVPEDITKIVEFLVDDVNGFITGQVIYRIVLFIWLYIQKFFFVFFFLSQNFVVDGGMTKKMIYHE
jgi:NAD(P)-dependent dehydrogenase (short-subunit alcohol dehydrogenase family)